MIGQCRRGIGLRLHSKLPAFLRDPQGGPPLCEPVRSWARNVLPHKCGLFAGLTVGRAAVTRSRTTARAKQKRVTLNPFERISGQGTPHNVSVGVLGQLRKL